MAGEASAVVEASVVVEALGLGKVFAPDVALGALEGEEVLAPDVALEFYAVVSLEVALVPYTFLAFPIAR